MGNTVDDLFLLSHSHLVLLSTTQKVLTESAEKTLLSFTKGSQHSFYSPGNSFIAVWTRALET
jgi:hypothetical protein